MPKGAKNSTKNISKGERSSRFDEKAGFCFGVDNLALTDFSELYKLAIGYENDLSEQFYSAFSPRSALFWSHVFFAKQSVRSNQQLEAIQRTSNSLLGEKARGFFYLSFFLFPC